MIGCILIFVGILICGFVLGYITAKPKHAGILKYDVTDPDGPSLFLDLDMSPYEIEKEEYVIFKVEDVWDSHR